MSLVKNNELLSNDKLKALLTKVEETLAQTFTDSGIEQQVNTLCRTVISAGGKRIRPKVAILCATALSNYTKDYDEKIVAIAASLELLHTATLVHDDVIDESPLRRGAPTINSTNGNHIAVLAGDYMFTRCFITLHKVLNIDIIKAFSATLGTLVSGELFQLEHEGDLSISYDQYENIIYAKTGALFELAVSSISIALGVDDSTQEKLKEFGRQIGIAFQVVDDILDYNSDNKTLGKIVGEDLKDKRVTLPIIITLSKLSDSDKNTCIKYIEDANLDGVMSFIQKTDALNESYNYAKKAVEKAIDCLDCLEDGESKTILINLTKKIITRSN